MRNHLKVAIVIFSAIMFWYCTVFKSATVDIPGLYETMFVLVIPLGGLLSYLGSDIVVTAIFKHYYKKLLMLYKQRQHLYLYADTPGFHEKLHKIFVNVSLLDSYSEYDNSGGRLKLRADLLLPLRRAVANVDILNNVDHKTWTESTNTLPTDLFAFNVKDRLRDMLPKPPPLPDLSYLKEAHNGPIQNHLDEDLMEKVK